MSDFLTRLADRALGRAAPIDPLIRSRYASGQELEAYDEVATPRGGRAPQGRREAVRALVATESTKPPGPAAVRGARATARYQSPPAIIPAVDGPRARPGAAPPQAAAASPPAAPALPGATVPLRTAAPLPIVAPLPDTAPRPDAVPRTPARRTPGVDDRRPPQRPQSQAAPPGDEPGGRPAPPAAADVSSAAAPAATAAETPAVLGNARSAARAESRRAELLGASARATQTVRETLAPTAALERSRAIRPVVSEEQPPVHVTIGRVEVRAPAAAPPPAAAPTPTRPALSLDDYLRTRGGVG